MRLTADQILVSRDSCAFNHRPCTPKKHQTCETDQLFALAAFEVLWLKWICSHSNVYPAMRLPTQSVAQRNKHLECYVTEMVVAYLPRHD